MKCTVQLLNGELYPIVHLHVGEGVLYVMYANKTGNKSNASFEIWLLNLTYRPRPFSH